jgi:hypothetical protein
MSHIIKKRRADKENCISIIEEICTIGIDDISPFARHWMKTQGDSFHNAKGLPTRSYKLFLLCIVTYIAERDPSFTSVQYDKIRQFLTTWEEDAFGGLMYVHPDEPMYSKYIDILQAIYGNHIPEMSADRTLPISNSYVIGSIIPAIKRGCQYESNCIRKKALHIKLMHPNEKKEGGKRSTLKRSTLKRKTRRTHKN